MQAQLQRGNLIKRFKLNISEDAENRLINFFTGFCSEQEKEYYKKMPSGPAFYHISKQNRYGVYSLLLRNCVTFAMDALPYALGGNLPSYLEYQNTPLDLYNTLRQSDFLGITLYETDLE